MLSHDAHGLADLLLASAGFHFLIQPQEEVSLPVWAVRSHQVNTMFPAAPSPMCGGVPEADQEQGGGAEELLGSLVASEQAWVAKSGVPPMEFFRIQVVTHL